MNNLDLAGLLTTYAIKCQKATRKENLQELIKALKRELNTDQIKKIDIYTKT